MSNIKKNLVQSSVSLAILQVIETIISIIMIPLMIRYLGNDEYGIWVIVLSIVTYLNVINTGITNATQRYLSIAIGSKSTQKLYGIVNSSLFIYILISIISTIIVYITAHFGDFFVDTKVNIFYVVTLIIGIKISLSIPTSVFYALLAANLRQDLQSYIEIFMVTLRSGLIIGALLNNGGVIEIATIVLTVELTCKLFIVLAAIKTSQHIEYSRSYIIKSQIIELLSFGFYALIIRLTDSIKATSHNFLVTKTIGVGSVIFVSMPFMIVAYLIQFLNLTLSVFYPFLSRLFAAKKRLTILKNLSIALDISFFVSSLMTIGLLIFGDIFIQLVLGDGYNQAKHILHIFSAYLIIQGSNIPLYFLFGIYNKQKLLMYLSILEVGCVILIEYALLDKYGLDYIAWGLIIPSAIVRLIVIPYFLIKSVDTTFIKLISLIIRPIYFCFLVIAFQLFIEIDSNLIESWYGLIFGAITISLIYFTLFYIFLSTQTTRQLLKKYKTTLSRRFLQK